ncbi:uncharacterized protein LOC116290517 [Actinia tenebrosa]|uniref:Uncharacterized protein LOC116290517 n=1 Tax=Actinia tenebrosa TaxID=6105 RepID=A0A6P8HEI4_ACTTE|nr:uncharacterized protein LOC116290517 [Actinia tenebrosa]XP_031553423.1 uncharacterized protein LOC116290517 [Actinia tenebrosa]
MDMDTITRPILERFNREEWPIIFWFYVKSLGLFHSGALVQPIRCCKCRNSRTHTNYHTFNDDNEVCKICDSFRWNYLGISTELRDRDIGSSCFNHCGSGVFSWLWLITITVATITNISIISHRYLNTEVDIVHTLSWIGSNLLLFIAPMTCLVSVLHRIWPNTLPGQWAGAVDVEFLIGRLRLINMRKKQYAGYVAFVIGVAFVIIECIRLSCPFFDKELVTNIAVNHTYVGVHSTFILDIFLTIQGYINFCGLCYVVYLLRCSYESEVRLVTKFLRDNIDDVDLCRARLAESFDAFHIFREFSSGWIAMNLIICTICILLDLHVWITTTVPLAPFQYEHTFVLVIFLLFPMMAIGNVDCDYIWNRLLRRVSRERTTKDEESWNRVMQFLQEQKAGQRPWQAVLAFILSTIAIFAAIQFRLWSNHQGIVNIVIQKNGTLFRLGHTLQNID